MRYYFDVNGMVDNTGTELPGPEAVPHEALGLILAVAADNPELVHTLSLTVRNQERNTIYTASLQLEGKWQQAAS